MVASYWLVKLDATKQRKVSWQINFCDAKLRSVFFTSADGYYTCFSILRLLEKWTTSVSAFNKTHDATKWKRSKSLSFSTVTVENDRWCQQVTGVFRWNSGVVGMTEWYNEGLSRSTMWLSAEVEGSVRIELTCLTQGHSFSHIAESRITDVDVQMSEGELKLMSLLSCCSYFAMQLEG